MDTIRPRIVGFPWEQPQHVDPDPEPNIREPLLRAEDVAARLACSKRAAYRLMATGDIVVVRVGNLVRVQPSDLDRYIDAHRSSREP